MLTKPSERQLSEAEQVLWETIRRGLLMIAAGIERYLEMHKRK